MRRRATLPILIPMAWITVYLLGAGWDFLSPVVGGSATTSASCGSALLVEQTAGRIFPAESTRVLLVLDDEWRRRFGEDGSGVARSLLTEVSGMFKGVHIHLLPVGIASWTAPRGARTAETLLHAARVDVDPGGADVAIIFTGRTLAGSDGWSEVGGRYALVSHHPGRPDRDAFVLAHEIAHLFGADHSCDLEDHEGLMASAGFAEPRLICPCTRQILETNAARFHQAVAGDGIEQGSDPSSESATPQ